MSLTTPVRPTPPPRGPSGRGRGGVVGLLVALTLGAFVAGVYVLVGAAAPTAAPAPFPARGVVVASASCTDATGRDAVEIRTADGVPRTLPLDACGSGVGSIVDVTVTQGDPVAHLAGTGRATSAAGGSAGSGGVPLSQRLAVTLGTVAALGTTGLLVAVARERLSAGRTDRPSRRPARGAPGQ